MPLFKVGSIIYRTYLKTRLLLLNPQKKFRNQIFPNPRELHNYEINKF